jgi:hypothetical protein
MRHGETVDVSYSLRTSGTAAHLIGDGKMDIIQREIFR